MWKIRKIIHNNFKSKAPNSKNQHFAGFIFYIIYSKDKLPNSNMKQIMTTINMESEANLQSYLFGKT